MIAETGAGQHGVATATACALLDLDCTVYMGAEDVERQALNVFRMKMLGATVVPVSLPSTAAALSAYYVIACAEAASNLARYDGVRYGARGPAEAAPPAGSGSSTLDDAAGNAAEALHRLYRGTRSARRQPSS